MDCTNLKIGDELIYCDRACNNYIVTIESETPTTFRLSNKQSILKKNGSVKSSEKWFRPSVSLATPELKAEIAETNKRNRYKSIIRNLATSDIDYLATWQMEDIITVFNNAKKEINNTVII